KPNDGGTEEPTKPDKPSDDGTGDTSQPDDTDQDNSDGTEEPTEPDKPSDGGTGEPTQPDKPSDDGTGDTSQSDDTDQDNSDGTEEPTEPVNPSDDGTGDTSQPDDSNKTTSSGSTNQNNSGPNNLTELNQSDDSKSNTGGHATEPTNKNSSILANPIESSKSNKPIGSSNSSTTIKPSESSTHESNTIEKTKSSQTIDNNENDQNLSSNEHSNSSTQYVSGNSEDNITYSDLAVNDEEKNEDSDDGQLISRFNQMSVGSFKYNPFVLNQVRQLNNNVDKVSDKDISAILRKQDFADNSYLNKLQKDTNYFKFQYFNPLKSTDYYKNLDKQVLALITGDIGTMPDLKKPEGKALTGKYEYHSSTDEEMTHTKEKEASDTIDIKFERTLFALMTAMIMIFIGMVVGYFVHRKNKK
ncbi:SdrH family protein, partial [Staphylococcus succinus]